MARYTNRTSLLAAALFAAGFWIAGFSTNALAAEPNDTFGEATSLAPGVVTVSDALEGYAGLAPDTYLGFFADATFSLPTLAEDDDSGFLGDGLDSALFDLPVNADGSIPLAVTGCCDGFSGSHSFEGDYELFVDVFDATGAPIDSFSMASTLSPGVVDEFPFFSSAWIGGTFDAYIDNTVGIIPGTDPLDFWTFSGLTPGASYIAEIADADFDTILASLTPAGDIDDVDDDSGVGLLSKLTITATATGEAHLAVTGFNDFGLSGLHPQSGSYDLTISPVPEPTALASAIVGLVVCSTAYRRR